MLATERFALKFASFNTFA